MSYRQYRGGRIDDVSFGGERMIRISVQCWELSVYPRSQRNHLYTVVKGV